MQCTYMESMPRRSGDSHPRRLVEQQKVHLPCLALPQNFFAKQVGLLCSSEGSLWVEEVHKFLLALPEDIRHQ